VLGIENNGMLILARALLDSESQRACSELDDPPSFAFGTKACDDA